MVTYAELIGRAFQITDDILDTCGDTALLGKPVKSDEKNDKSTYVAFYGVEKCKEIVVDLTNKAIDCLEKIDGDISFLKELTIELSSRNH